MSFWPDISPFPGFTHLAAILGWKGEVLGDHTPPATCISCSGPFEGGQDFHQEKGFQSEILSADGGWFRIPIGCCQRSM